MAGISIILIDLRVNYLCLTECICCKHLSELLSLTLNYTTTPKYFKTLVEKYIYLHQSRYQLLYLSTLNYLIEQRGAV